jgi:hypothetical protein
MAWWTWLLERRLPEVTARSSTTVVVGGWCAAAAIAARSRRAARVVVGSGIGSWWPASAAGVCREQHGPLR